MKMCIVKVNVCSFKCAEYFQEFPKNNHSLIIRLFLCLQVATAIREHRQLSKSTITYTGNLNEHSPAVKLQEIHVVQLLFSRQSQLDVLH